MAKKQTLRPSLFVNKNEFHAPTIQSFRPLPDYGDGVDGALIGG